jgi:TatD DNase family protein
VRLFDVHVHLQEPRLSARLNEVVTRAAQAGIVRMLCCGLCEADWPEVARICRMHPETVIPAFGLHPGEMASRTDGWLETLRAVLVNHPEAALGEIGLDRPAETGNAVEQEALFRAQLELGRELNRPLVIHNRRATDRLLSLLRETGPFPAGIVLHSFGGPAELVGRFLPFNAYFSFSGSITWPEARRVRSALQAVPIERLLLETDAPYLRIENEDGTGRTTDGEPGDLAVLVRAAAAIRNEPVEVVAEASWLNAGRLFLRTGAGP